MSHEKGVSMVTRVLSAQAFAEAMRLAGEGSEITRKSLETIWRILYERRWPISILNKEQWREVLDEAATQTSIPRPDVYAAVLTLANQNPDLLTLISKGMAVASDTVETSVLTRSMFGSYDDLYAAFCAAMPPLLGSDPGESSVYLTSGLWVMAHWTLLWMGLPTQGTTSVERSKVRISTLDHHAEIKTDFGVFTLDHPGGVRILQDALTQGVGVNAKVPDSSFIGVSYASMGDIKVRFNRSMQRSGLERDPIIDKNVYYSGRFAAVKEALLASGTKKLPTTYAELASLVPFCEPAKMRTQYKWATVFRSWWDVYGDPDIQ